jgi:hypothetical protein
MRAKCYEKEVHHEEGRLKKRSKNIEIKIESSTTE